MRGRTTVALALASAAALVLTGHVQLWMVFVLALFDGIVGAFDGPARQAFVSEMVPLRNLPNAIGLNSTSWNAARLIGPGVAGILIAAFGTGQAFAINAFSFLILIGMLIWMDPKAMSLPVRNPAAKKEKSSILDGLRYVSTQPKIAMLLVVAFMLGTFGFNYSITNTLMTTQVFDKSAGLYGMLGSVMGVGSLTGALMAAKRKKPRVRFFLVFLGVFGLALCLSAIAPNFWVFTALMVPIGFAGVSCMVSANSMIQVMLPPEVRGRVMALWVLCSMGLTPVVSPLLGWIGDAFGARATVWVGAIAIVMTFLGMVWWLFGKQHIRLYRDEENHFWVRYPGMAELVR